jgi:hypothetical protein
MLATIVILVITVAAVQLIGDALVRLTTPHRRFRSGAVRSLRRRKSPVASLAPGTAAA